MVDNQETQEERSMGRDRGRNFGNERVGAVLAGEIQTLRVVMSEKPSAQRYLSVQIMPLATGAHLLLGGQSMKLTIQALPKFNGRIMPLPVPSLTEATGESISKPVQSLRASVPHRVSVTAPFFVRGLTVPRPSESAGGEGLPVQQNDVVATAGPTGEVLLPSVPVNGFFNSVLFFTA